MDRYRQFIEDMRRTRPQMPHPEEVSARIAERTGTMPQDIPAGPAPLRSGRIRLAAAVTGITGIAAAAVLRYGRPHRDKQPSRQHVSLYARAAGTSRTLS